jgi:Spy/CpxP family protein refolding chaperone
MKRRNLILMSVVAVVLTGSAYAAIRHERSNRPIIDRIVGRLTKQLDLTAAQQTQVRSILETERPKVSPLLADVAKNRQQLHDSTAGGKFDEAQVRLIAAQQAQTMTELMVEKERVKSKIYNEVLTAEQRTKADQMIERMKERFRNRIHAGLESNGSTVP